MKTRAAGGISTIVAGVPSPVGPAADRLVCGDNLDVMGALPDGGCDLIYADPPFFSRRLVRGSGDHSWAFDDRFRGGAQAYLDDLRPRLAEMRRLLSPAGSLYVHLDARIVHYVKVMLDGLFGERCFLNEIIWHYRSGGRPGRWFPRKHDTLLVYVKLPGAHTFHCQREGAYRTCDLRVSADGRPYKSTRRGPIYFHPDGPAVSDVWDIPFLSTVSTQRTGYPTQKPEALLERVICASSSPGDVVGDFYCGSGTALAVARRLGRRWLGCDINPAAVGLAQRRVDAAAVEE